MTDCLVTCLKLPLRLCSQSIMSWKMGIMTFLRSGCGTSVTSRNGPIIAGMKFNLCSPGEEKVVAIATRSLISEHRTPGADFPELNI